MWEAVKHALKPRGVFVTTASQPFTSALIASNYAWFHQELVWVKQHPKGFLDAHRKHLDTHETIVVFSQSLPYYDPQGLIPVHVKSGRKNKSGNGVYGSVGNPDYVQLEGNFPRSVLYFDAITQNNLHETQKPVDLFAYLIRTYTQEGELVVDPCCGSGTTAAACIATNRRYIVGDSSEHYCEVTRQRLLHPSKQELKAALAGKPVTVPMFDF